MCTYENYIARNYIANKKRNEINQNEVRYTE